MRKYIAIIGAILLIAAASTAYALGVIEKVTGGGAIAVTDGYATFGIVSQDGNGVAKKSDGVTYKGNVEYVDHSGSVELNLHSVDITRLYRDTTTLLVVIEGTATVNGATINGNPYTFKVEVADNGEPGSDTATTNPDEFYITIYNPDGLEYYSRTGGDLTGGNIQVFLPKGYVD